MNQRQAWYQGWAVVTRTFPGHRGRPGQRGGSLPREGSADGKFGELSTAGLGKVNKAFLTYFRDELQNPYYQTTKSINSGFCYSWAWTVHERFGSELWINDDFSHAFVKHGGLFYDAETRKGVRNWINIKGLRQQRKGLENLIKHGASRTRGNVSGETFKQELLFKKDHADRVLSILASDQD